MSIADQELTDQVNRGEDAMVHYCSILLKQSTLLSLEYINEHNLKVKTSEMSYQ